jgi:hypothetical protein
MLRREAMSDIASTWTGSVGAPRITRVSSTDQGFGGRNCRVGIDLAHVGFLHVALSTPTYGGWELVVSDARPCVSGAGVRPRQPTSTVRTRPFGRMRRREAPRRSTREPPRGHTWSPCFPAPSREGHAASRLQIGCRGYTSLPGRQQTSESAFASGRSFTLENGRRTAYGQCLPGQRGQRCQESLFPWVPR